MTAETIAAVASVGTFVVIAVTAAAALIQLRHIRSANQLAGLLQYIARWESDTIQSATSFVEKELPAKLEDREFQSSLWLHNPDRQLHPELRAADWCEQMGSYIKYGMISEAQYLDLGGWYVISMWERLRAVVAIRRAATGTNAMYENFEYIAARAMRWSDSHPDGDYPRGVGRLMLDEEWKALQKP